MRKHWFKCCLFALMPLANAHAEKLSCSVGAESAILMNADTGAILFEKNAHELQFPASTTKVATAAYALHKASDKLNEILVVDQEAVVSITEEKRRRGNYSAPAYWLTPGGSHIGLKRGEEMSLNDLMFGMMIASGNDAANVIAQYVGGTIPDCMDCINAYLKEIGCKNTTFYNPHGLHHPKHQTTAYDMAVMTRDAMKHPIFRQIVSTVRFPRPKTNKQDTTTLVNTNRLIKKGKHYYAKAIGVKTGYTSHAGSTLVAAAKQGDRTLIAVLLKCKEREDTLKDSVALFEAAFNQPKVKRVFLKAGPQDFKLDLPGAASSIATLIPEDVSVEYYSAEEPQLKCFLAWSPIEPPVVQGQKVGELQLKSDDGKVVQMMPLLAQADVNSTWIWSIKKVFSGNSSSPVLKWLGFSVVFLFFGGLLLQLRRR